MRLISFEKITETVEKLCIDAAFELPDDIAEAIKQAAQSETDLSAQKILYQLLENANQMIACLCL